MRSKVAKASDASVRLGREVLLEANEEVVKAAVHRNGNALRFASERMRDNEEVVKAAVEGYGLALEYASNRLKDNEEVVRAAVHENGRALQFASERMKDSEEVVKAAVEGYGLALRYASNRQKDNEEVVMAAVKKFAWALECASNRLKDNAEVVKAAVHQTGRALRDASERMRDNEEVVKAAVEEDAWALEYASNRLKDNEEVVKAAVRRSGRALEGASKRMRDNEEVVKAAVEGYGLALEYASDRLKDNEEVVKAAVRENGDVLQYASDRLRGDKECVMFAAETTPGSLKWAKGSYEDPQSHEKLTLAQDPKCLRAAGIWNDAENVKYDRPEEMILSVRYSLAEKCTDYATNVHVALKKHGRLGKFKIYFPSAFAKDSCDPKFTNVSHPCRGTSSTCQMSPPLNMAEPTNKHCWRYSFRSHQKICKDTGGPMIQFEELDPKQFDSDGKCKTLLSLPKDDPEQIRPVWLLGDGQRIESEMAKELDLKIFRVRQGTISHPFFFKARPFDIRDADRISKAIMKWFVEGVRDLNEEVIQLEDTLNLHIASEGHP